MFNAYSAVKQLITINHIQNKRFCLHNICVYIYYVYIITHTCMYIFMKTCYVYMSNIFIYNIKYNNIRFHFILKVPLTHSVDYK